MIRILILLVVVVAAIMAFVRLMPIDPAGYVQLPTVDGPGDIEGARSFTATRALQTTPEGVLRAVEAAAHATSRTRVVHGGVKEGRFVFETRSAVWGFPDFTTVGFQDGLLVIHGRARYGASDIGVNKARITGWLAQLGPLVVAPS